MLRVKSTHDATEYPAAYRSLLVNFRYASTKTVPQVLGSHDDDLGNAWKEHCEKLPEPAHWRFALNALHRLAAATPAPPLAVVAEVQFVLRPYYEEGRTRSHLLFKIARANTPGEMVRDFSQSLAAASIDDDAEASRRAAIGPRAGLLAQIRQVHSRGFD